MSDEAKLILRLEARTKKFEKDLTKAISKLDGSVQLGNRKWDKGMSKMERRAKRMAGRVGKALAGITIGAPVLATASIIALTKNTLQYADELEHASQQLGINSERIQELDFVASRMGLTTEQMRKALQRATANVGEFAATGSGEAAEAIKSMGLEGDIMSGKISNGADVFDVLSKKVAATENPLEAAGIAAEIFGKRAGVQMVEALSLGEDGLAELKKEARQLGTVLDADAVAKGSKANDTLAKLGDTLRGNLRGAVIDNADEITAFTEDLIDMVPQLIDWGRNVIDGFAEIGTAIEAAGDAWNVSPFGKGEAEVASSKSQIRKQIDELDDLHTAILIVNRNPIKSFIGSAFDGEDNPFKTRDFLTQPRDVKNDIGKNLFGKEVYDRNKNDADALINLVLAKKAALEEALKVKETQSETPPKKKGRATTGVPVSGASGAASGSSDAEAAVERQIALIRELGKTEEDQINDLLELRLSAIEKSKLAEADKSALRGKAHEDAKAEIAELEAANLEASQKLQAEQEAQRRDEFDLRQEQLGYLSEVEAAQARMAGRSIEAYRIEMDALEERYQAELDYIEQVINEKGSTPELEAELADATAGLAGAREERLAFERETLAQIDALTNDSTRLENALAAIDEAEQAKIDKLADYYGQTEALTKEHQDRLSQIEAEADESRLQTRLESYSNNLSSLQGALSGFSNALRAAGKEDTKAAKIAAKAQQIVAIGEAGINTAQGVTKALALGPVGIPLAVAIGALGAAQIAVMASQTFDGGGFTGRGARVGGLDGKGGFMAMLHPNETVVDHTRPNAPIAGKTLEAGLGLSSGVSLPRSVSPRSINGANRPSGGDTFSAGNLIIQGNVDESALPRLEAAMEDFINNQEKNFTAMADARDKRTTPRTKRRVGRGRSK